MSSSPHPTVDAHLHLVNFMQESDGATALLHRLEEGRVKKAVVFGLPITKLWADWDSTRPQHMFDNDSPAYYYSYTDQIVLNMLQDVPAEKRHNFAPLICGFNPLDKFAITHVERLYAANPRVWKGIGEILFRHSYLSHLTQGDTARPDCPSMFPIYEFAGNHHLPILIHQDISSVEDKINPIYLAELENALRQFPQTTFVWAHCGCTPNVSVEHQYQHVERVLQTYPNLYCDISWAIFEKLLYREHEVSRRWIELLEKYADRFCLGSDLTGHFEKLPEEIKKYDVILKELSPQARSAVASETAEKLYFS